MTSSFPDELKILKVVVVYKDGETEDPYSYKPIAVLPTIARVFEKLTYGELYNYFTKNNLLGNKQFGFRSLHSTALALGKSEWIIG